MSKLLKLYNSLHDKPLNEQFPEDDEYAKHVKSSSTQMTGGMDQMAKPNTQQAMSRSTPEDAQHIEVDADASDWPNKVVIKDLGSELGPFKHNPDLDFEDPGGNTPEMMEVWQYEASPQELNLDTDGNPNEILTVSINFEYDYPQWESIQIDDSNDNMVARYFHDFERNASAAEAPKAEMDELYMKIKQDMMDFYDMDVPMDVIKDWADNYHYPYSSWDDELDEPGPKVPAFETEERLDFLEYLRDEKGLNEQGCTEQEIAEGTCGYGVDGELGDEPAGPKLQNLVREIIKKHIK